MYNPCLRWPWFELTEPTKTLGGDGNPLFYASNTILWTDRQGLSLGDLL